MKNNKAFTLIELLAAIIILAAIMLVSFPILLNAIKNSEKQIDEVTRRLVENAASLYIDNHPDDYPTNDNLVRCIDINTLVAEKFLEGAIIEQNSALAKKNKISVTHNGTNFEYEITDRCESSTICSLPEGLTPVIHNGTDWVIADTTKEWFNYNRQEWANAVVLKSGVSNTVGTIIYPDGNNNNITAMFVCVPRYQYMIEGEYGVHLEGTMGTQKTPGEIKARIIPKEQTTATTNYKIPSAFKFGDEELDSIWVGKFELSHTSTYTEQTTSSLSENYLACNNESCYDTATKIRILPNVYSAVNNNISNFFFTIRSMNDALSLTNSDIHMIKSSEWEATAYFSQSIFGKYGNYLYKNTNKEVFHNNSVITGQSSGTTGTSSTIACTYDDVSNKGSGPCGIGASTTGNITGIYDMAGGNFEFVMGKLSNGVNDNSGFSTLPNSRYYDVYTSSEEKVFGDAMNETKGWYNNIYELGLGDTASNISSWFDVGGKAKQAAGIFYISSNGGQASSYSTRPVITLSED